MHLLIHLVALIALLGSGLTTVNGHPARASLVEICAGGARHHVMLGPDGAPVSHAGCQECCLTLAATLPDQTPASRSGRAGRIIHPIQGAAPMPAMPGVGFHARAPPLI